MSPAPGDLDWVSLPHLLASAEPLRCELRRRASEWHQKSGRRRQLKWIKQATSRLALKQILREIEQDRIRASRKLLILFRRCILAAAPPPPELLEFVTRFAGRLNSPVDDGVREAAVLRSKRKGAGRPTKFASRDRKIVQAVAELRWTRVDHLNACQNVAEMFGLSDETVRAIWKRERATRAQAHMHILDREAWKAKTLLGSDPN